jgi:hypothetical protein
MCVVAQRQFREFAAARFAVQCPRGPACAAGRGGERRVQSVCPSLCSCLCSRSGRAELSRTDPRQGQGLPPGDTQTEGLTRGQAVTGGERTARKTRCSSRMPAVMQSNHWSCHLSAGPHGFQLRQLPVLLSAPPCAPSKLRRAQYSLRVQRGQWIKRRGTNARRAGALYESAQVTATVMQSCDCGGNGPYC